MLLKKEVNKTHTEGDSDESGNYRQVLIQLFCLIFIFTFMIIVTFEKDNSI